MSVNLFLRSEYSLLSSLCAVDNSVKKAKEYGYQAIAITDFNHLAGTVHFKKACEKNNLKPLYGMEVMVEINERQYPVVLLAKNDSAYVSLMHLATYLDENKHYINYLKLQEYCEECFVILESDNMYATTSFTLNQSNQKEYLLESIGMFKGEVVVGLFDSDNAYKKSLNYEIKRVCRANDIKTVYMMHTFYLNSDDEDAYRVLKAIKEKKLYDDPNLEVELGKYLYRPEDLNELYDQEDLIYSDYIAAHCNVKLDMKTSLPKYRLSASISSRDYLINLCKEGLKRRLKGHKNVLYENRLKHELKIIISMHFEDYFLIVYDFILYAKKHDILVGPGRGSAAGSLVSYCLGITDIDPIRYGLIFERFLNPERITMPDIDVDFPDDRRDEVINYCKEKYGKEYVGHIVTYGTLKAKQVIRDVGRVLNYPLNEIDMLCKYIPNDPKMTLEKAMGVQSFKTSINANSKYRHLYEICLKLEGLPRHASTHAAGIVMSLKPLKDIVPLFSLETDIYTTQITGGYLEEFGLIKMDFLGLRNLSILHEVIDDVRKDNPDFRIENIPLDDSKTFKLIDDVNTLGVFQLESAGMQNLIRKLSPKNFEEIALTIALFRPGPMENIPLFVENRNHPEMIEYLHDDIKHILEDTYGIIIYQEQIMMIATKMANFPMSKADKLRKAMSKKKLDELNGLSKDFIDGCKANGYSEDLAVKLYDLILKFANYGFNKSHSIAYAKVAYEMAYLKANYPLYFYKALLNGVIGSQSKTYEYLSECQKVNVEIKGFSINRSSDVYIINQGSIIMPLNIIRDIGNNIVNIILTERYDNGPFKSYEDTIVRLFRLGIGHTIFENLIMAGAFDEFELSRKTMKENLEVFLKFANASKGGQMRIIEVDISPEMIKYKDNMFEKANDEKAVLGFYFSVNPIMNLKKQYHIEVDSFIKIGSNLGKAKGFGQIHRIREHRTKKGDWMAFIQAHDETGDLDLVVMPNLYREYQGKLKKGDYVYFEGIIEKINSCLVKSMKPFKEGENDQNLNR